MSHDTLTQVTAAAGTVARTFLTAFIAAILTAGNYSETTVKAALYAGAGSVLMVTYNWLNSSDTRYGIGYVPR
jgi:hypothetical protein